MFFNNNQLTFRGSNKNEYNITHLSYTNQDDFGFHIIRDNSNSSYLNHQATCISNELGKKSIYQASRKLFNSIAYDSYEHVYTDKFSDKHYRINDLFT